jgi:ribonuclease P/MRP protein subunit POP5
MQASSAPGQRAVHRTIEYGRSRTTRVKHLPKHLQERWRYLAVELETWPDRALERESFQRALWYGAQNLHGDPGSAALDLTVIRFHGGEGGAEAVVRTRRGERERARAVLACIDTVDDAPVAVVVRGTSGTVRGCEEKYMGAQPQEIVERDVVFEDAKEPGFVRAERVDVRVDGEFVGATTLET